MEKKILDSKKIAIITARGGSKRIPRKNIKDFFGQPIIKYSIDAALDSGIFDEVMVSTDDNAIAELAKMYGAKVPFMRSAETSGDMATTSDVILEVLNCYERDNINFEYFCCIYPTAPFLTGKKLYEAMTLLIEKKADSVLPIVKYSFPPQRGIIIENNLVKMKYPENMNARSQDLEAMYHDCGQFYCGNVKALKQTKRLITDNTIPFILQEWEVQDIDNIEDWEMAEIKYKLLNRKEG